MRFALLFLLFCLPALATPPAWPPAELLETVADDVALSADAALDALVSEVPKWSDQGDFPDVDLPSIVANPASFRGQTFHFTTGPATRVADRAFDIRHLSAWQTTSPRVGEPILLLIYEPNGTAAPGDHVKSIDLPACFYKTAMASMHLAGSLGATREDQPARPPQRILVFVGALPRFTAASTSNTPAWGQLVAALLVGGVVLLIMRRSALRRSASRPHVAIGAAREAWNDGDLPEEPAEALAELARRREDTISHD